MHEGRGVGELMARLALSGFGGMVILAPSSPRFHVAWATWLGRPVAAAQALLVPAPAAALRCWPVSHRVNSVQEEGADLMAPVGAG